MKNYFNAYYRTFGLLSPMFGAIPFVGKLSNFKYIAPPVELHFLFLFLLFLFILIFVSYFLKDVEFLKKSWGTPLVMGILLLISFVAFLYYFSWSQEAVREIHIPSLNETDYVIVGTERTDYSKKQYPNSTDVEMLKDGGYKKDDIRKLWTAKSVAESSLHIAGSYFAMILLLVGIVSVGVVKVHLFKI